MKIIRNGVHSWTNLHQTVVQQVTDVWDLANETTGSALQNYNDTVKGVQGIITDCIQSETPLRALGGSWSLSPIAATSGIILNTKGLNSIFTITKESTAPGYKKDASKLCFAQCGASVWELNDFLHRKGLSLSACGASNGQTIAGAVATGTHGAAVGFGGIQESVVGLHIITRKNRHVYLERSSYPVATDTFIAKLGATAVRDDEAFYAALVSFGSFGFVAGIMIEAEENYLLEAHLIRVPYDDVYRKAVTSLDFNFARLPHPGEKPFHFQTLINPYDIGGGAYMTIMYKRPYRKDYTPPQPNGTGLGPGDDAPCFIGRVGDALPALVPTVVNKVLAASLTPYSGICGRLAEIFNNTTLRGKVASAAYGLRPEDVARVIDILLAVNKSHGPFAGLFAFRFVRSSKALMAFTHFAPVSCVLELDGVLSAVTKKFYAAIAEAFEREDIPYTYHWGKMNLLNPERVRRMYGANLDRFLAARARLVDADLLRIFSNDAMKAWGIDGTIPGVLPASPSAIA